MIEYVDCGGIAAEIKNGISKKLGGGHPVLLVVRVGDAADDELFLRGLRRDAEELGIDIVTDTSAEPHTPGLDGILTLGDIAYTPPVHFDVDGISGVGRLRAVTEAALRIAERNTELRGKSAVVIGRGIGLQIARELLKRDMTVTVCHSKSDGGDIYTALYPADVVICAARNTAFFPANIKSEKLIVDISNGFDVKRKDPVHGCIKITPRKNGVGVVTRAVLLDRVADNYLKREGNKQS